MNNLGRGLKLLIALTYLASACSSPIAPTTIELTGTPAPSSEVTPSSPPSPTPTQVPLERQFQEAFPIVPIYPGCQYDFAYSGKTPYQILSDSGLSLPVQRQLMQDALANPGILEAALAACVNPEVALDGFTLPGLSALTAQHERNRATFGEPSADAYDRAALNFFQDNTSVVIIGGDGYGTRTTVRAPISPAYSAALAQAALAEGIDPGKIHFILPVLGTGPSPADYSPAGAGLPGRPEFTLLDETSFLANTTPGAIAGGAALINSGENVSNYSSWAEASEAIRESIAPGNVIIEINAHGYTWIPSGSTTAEKSIISLGRVSDDQLYISTDELALSIAEGVARANRTGPVEFLYVKLNECGGAELAERFGSALLQAYLDLGIADPPETYLLVTSENSPGVVPNRDLVNLHAYPAGALVGIERYGVDDANLAEMNLIAAGPDGCNWYSSFIGAGPETAGACLSGENTRFGARVYRLGPEGPVEFDLGQAYTLTPAIYGRYPAPQVPPQNPSEFMP